VVTLDGLQLATDGISDGVPPHPDDTLWPPQSR